MVLQLAGAAYFLAFCMLMLTGWALFGLATMALGVWMTKTHLAASASRPTHEQPPAAAL